MRVRLDWAVNGGDVVSFGPLHGSAETAQISTQACESGFLSLVWDQPEDRMRNGSGRSDLPITVFEP